MVAQAGRTQASRDRKQRLETITFSVRLGAFAVALMPFPLLLAPWVSLDGISGAYSGVGLTSLLATPFAAYMFDVSIPQAIVVSIGPVAVFLLAALTGYRYHLRRSVPWAPPAMFAVSVAIATATGSLVGSTHYGLTLLFLVSALLTLHQVAIRVHLILQGRRKLRDVSRILGVLTGAGAYRWSER